METIDSPKRIKALLASCPSTGNGVHRWLFRTALELHQCFADKQALIDALEAASAGCGREVPIREIEEAVRDSRTQAEGLGVIRELKRWPARDEDLIRAIVDKGPNLATLRDGSPVRWGDGGSHTEEVIDALFPENPLLCAGPKKELTVTKTREEWRGFLDRQQFIVPSPMSKPFGISKSGHRSMRTLDNTAQRKFIVVEFDQGSFDEHAAILGHLRRFAPLVLAVHSANKSLHGWYFCGDEPSEKVEKFFRYAVSLGGDRATWTSCQLVRMPDGLRENAKRQSIIFFNPQPMERK